VEVIDLRTVVLLLFEVIVSGGFKGEHIVTVTAWLRSLGAGWVVVVLEVVVAVSVLEIFLKLFFV
jgi:pyruvate/2-oxoglutarate/acetoin dehydrogenase E1 component